MGKKKIFNDPLYGLIQFPYDIIYQIIDHPYFQRLRRISQMGLAQFVYPGATHTRFQHTLGAVHLTNRAIEILQSKGVTISEEEHKAVNIAILLHDSGHGPFSHALEHTIIMTSHEKISSDFIDYFETYLEEDFSLVKKIFSNTYHRKFFHQLISSQLDVDRMDYLNRDSFFTGVVEGKIGYDRILAMLNVVDDQLVVEEKGLYSIEKFLIARRFMYWQVYLHKTAVSAELMLKLLLETLVSIDNNIPGIGNDHALNILLRDKDDRKLSKETRLKYFAQLDDYDVWNVIKILTKHDHKIVQYLSNSILNRKIFLTFVQENEFCCDFVNNLRLKIVSRLEVDEDMARNLVQQIVETKSIYDDKTNKILILMKDGRVLSFSDVSNFNFYNEVHKLHFLCYPRV